MRWAAPLLLLQLACTAKPQATEPPPVVEAVHSNLLTVADIRIAAGVDTTHAATWDAINCLRRFLTRKMDREAPNDYWYAPDIEHYGGPYAELRYAEYDSVGDLRYRPTVLEARPAGQGELLLKVMWSDEPGTQDLSTAKYAFEFLVRSTAEGARLSLPLEHNTAHWERRTVGQVTYIISPRHVFNPAEAEEQRIMIERLSVFFGVPIFPITYYSYAGPADLYATKGFLRHPLMGTITYGGMVDGTNNVHSGNDKDIYTHEVVHLFSQRKTKAPPNLLEEGLATLIGGSVGHDYAWHRANLERYLAADPSLDLRDRCTTTMRDHINVDTSVPYVIGAVLCERILRRDGKEGLFQVMSEGVDPWPALQRYGITPETLTRELRKELMLEPYSGLGPHKASEVSTAFRVTLDLPPVSMPILTASDDLNRELSGAAGEGIEAESPQAVIRPRSRAKSPTASLRAGTPTTPSPPTPRSRPPRSWRRRSSAIRKARA